MFVLIQSCAIVFFTTNKLSFSVCSKAPGSKSSQNSSTVPPPAAAPPASMDLLGLDVGAPDVPKATNGTAAVDADPFGEFLF